MTLQLVAGALHHAVTAFLVDRQSRNLSHHTLAYYRQELAFFLDFLDARGVTMLQDLTADDIRLYLVALAERRNGGGCHAAYRAIRALLLWVWDEYDYQERNPIERVSAPKRRMDIIPGVPLPDVEAMIEVCQGDRLAKRDKAILLTLLDTGARAFELLAWDVIDLDTTTGALEILHGKGNKKRTVYVGKYTRRAILAYLRTRGDLSETSPLFATRDGERFTVQGLRRILEKRAGQAGVKAPGLHDFRRAFALTMLRAGVDVFALQKLIGHSDLTTLRRYLAQVSEDLQAAHKKGSPVNGALKGR